MRKKLYVIIAIIILCFYLIPTKSIAETSSIADLREQRKKLQEKIAENTLQVDELQGQISDLMFEIQDLSDKIYKYEIEVAVLNNEIAELNKKIEEAQEQYDEVQKVYNRRKKALINRVVAQYEEGEVAYLDFLLSSKGIVEFISSYYLIGEIMEYDNELLRMCDEQKKQISQIKQELDSYKEELKSKKDEQEKSAIVLANTRVVKNNQMNNLTDQERELQNQIDEYQEATQKIEVELLMILTANLNSDYVGGALAWPVPGYTTLTSNYGMRTHPIFGIYKMHTGVDIAAPIGAYLVSANDGVVVKSVYSPSYGNLVVVDHGGGLSTLYAHGQERLVDVGDTVQRGQPVMIVGSTGISTGPHAHFEVRINGYWTNPLEYILKDYSDTNEEIDETEQNN